MDLFDVTLLNTLIPGTYRGVPIICSSSSIETGRKTVSHEFPNSDRRFVEDLGLKSEIITLTIVIPTETYLASRNALKDALEASGPGILTHPWYGIRKVSPTSVAISESTSEFGRCTFTVTFAVTSENPTISGSYTGGSINESLSSFDSSIGLWCSDNIDIPTLPHYGTGLLLGALTTTLISSSDSVSAGLTNPSSQKAAEKVSQKLREYKLYPGKVLSNPEDLNKCAQDLAVGLVDVSETYFKAFYAAKDAYSRVVSVPASNSYPAALNVALNTIYGLFKAHYFAAMCQSAVNADFATFHEIESVRAVLAAASREMSDILGQVPVADDLYELYSDTEKVLLDLQATAPELRQEYVVDMPCSVFSYLYYGTTDGADSIRYFNREEHPDPASLSGTIKFLERL